MFRDPDRKSWPTEINESTATIIVLNAVEEYIGGAALDGEMSPDNPKTLQAMEDLEDLSRVLWRFYTKTGHWLELAAALEDRIVAKHRYLVNMENAQAAKVAEEGARKIEAAEAGTGARKAEAQERKAATEVQEGKAGAEVEAESDPKIKGREVCAS